MRSMSNSIPAIVCVCILSGAIVAPAQQVTVSSPHTAVSDSFFEHTGTSWGAQGRNWFFQFGPQGNPNGAAPQFGGFSPSAGANFGFGFNGGGFLGNLSQGSRRSFTSTTPSVTLQNGGTGMIMDTSVSPFVMGYIPIVGAYPIFGPVQPMVPPPVYVTPEAAPGHPAVLQALHNVPQSPMPSTPHVVGAHVPEHEGDDFTLIGPDAAANSGGTTGRLQASSASTAGQPAMSVADAKRLRETEAAQRDVEAQQFMQRGRYAEADGKVGAARIFYRMAARRASPDLRKEALERLAALPQTEESSR